jgi:hypothetical protein
MRRDNSGRTNANALINLVLSPFRASSPTSDYWTIFHPKFPDQITFCAGDGSGISHPRVQCSTAFIAAATARVRRFLVRPALPSRLIAVEMEQPVHSQSPENPGDRVSHTARTIAFVGTVVHSGVFDDVAPILETGATPHAAQLPVRAGMTGENIADERGGRCHGFLEGQQMRVQTLMMTEAPVPPLQGLAQME